MTDEQRDAYLREALRHAPDAQAQPPDALSTFILNEARAKARDAAPAVRPARNWAAAVWGWLARPSVAAGFAGVMAATLVGLMWWDQPMNEALPRRPEPTAAPAPAPAPAPVAAAAAPASAAAPPPTAATPTVLPPSPAQEARERTASPFELRKERKPAPEAEADKKLAEAAKRAAPAATPVAPAAPAAEIRGDPTQAMGEAAPAAAKPTPRPAPTPTPTPTPAPALAAAPPAFADRAATSADALAKSKTANAEPARSRMAAGAADALNASGAVKAGQSETRERRAAPAPASIGRLRAVIAAEPARWSWQRGSGPAQGMTDALYAWLAQLDSATDAAWQARAARETAPALGRELRLLRDGRVLHTLRLTERSVLWEREQNSWQSALTAAQLAELQAALDAAAP